MTQNSFPSSSQRAPLAAFNWELLYSEDLFFLPLWERRCFSRQVNNSKRGCARRIKCCMHVCQSAERDRRNGARGSQKGRSARRRRPKMIIATNHEHTHTNRLRGAALAKVRLSFFVSLHLFQITSKKFTISLQFYNCLPAAVVDACVCVFSRIK